MLSPTAGNRTTFFWCMTKSMCVCVCVWVWHFYKTNEKKYFFFASFLTLLLLSNVFSCIYIKQQKYTKSLPQKSHIKEKVLLTFSKLNLHTVSKWYSSVWDLQYTTVAFLKWLKLLSILRPHLSWLIIYQLNQVFVFCQFSTFYHSASLLDTNNDDRNRQYLKQML